LAAEQAKRVDQEQVLRDEQEKLATQTLELQAVQEQVAELNAQREEDARSRQRLAEKVVAAENAQTELTKQLEAARAQSATEQARIEALEAEVKRRQAVGEKLETSLLAETTGHRQTQRRAREFEAKWREAEGQLERKIAAEQAWHERETALEGRLQRLQQQNAEFSATLAIRNTELQATKEQLERQGVVENALCVKIKELTATEESLSETLSEREQQIQTAEARIKEEQQTRAALHYAVLEATRWMGQLAREQFQAARRDAESLNQTVGALLNTPLSGVQRALASALQEALENWMKHQAHALNTLDFRVAPPNFATAEFNVTEATKVAFQVIQRTAQIAGIEVKTAIAPNTPERIQASAAHLHQLITLLTTSLFKLVDTDRVDLRVAVEPGDSGPAQFALDVVLHTNGHSQATSERLASLTDAAGATPSVAAYGEAESGMAVCSQLARALCGQVRVEPPDNGAVRVRATLPVQTVVSPAVAGRNGTPPIEKAAAPDSSAETSTTTPAAHVPAAHLAEVA
jgi:hypothetical protein